jgi:hypothetical protein
MTHPAGPDKKPIAEAKHVRRLVAAGPPGGWASVAGGWKGSKEVAEKALEYGRSAPRAIPTALSDARALQ